MSQRASKNTTTLLKRKSWPGLTLSRGCSVYVNILNPLNDEMEKPNICRSRISQGSKKTKEEEVTQPSPKNWRSRVKGRKESCSNRESHRKMKLCGSENPSSLPNCNRPFCTTGVRGKSWFPIICGDQGHRNTTTSNLRKRAQLQALTSSVFFQPTFTTFPSTAPCMETPAYQGKLPKSP